MLTTMLEPYDINDNVLSGLKVQGVSYYVGRDVGSNKLLNISHRLDKSWDYSPLSRWLNKKEGCYVIDLGQVNFSAEIWVNGVLAGVRIWNPYRLDITAFIKDGENRITVIAANSAAVERRYMLVDEGMAVGWDRYWNEDNIDREAENLVSGLLGPVRIFRYQTAPESA